MAIRSEEYNQIIREYLDIEDKTTRNVIFAIDEADQTQVLASLTSKLYDHIINRVDDIDYGDIPYTKGDVTKMTNYNELIDSLDVMKSLMDEYKQKANPIDTVIEALDNIRSRKDLFEKAFKLNIELPMVTYCTMVLGVLQANAYLISTCIEFIKYPNVDSYQATVDKIALNKTKDALVLKNLEKFNICCKKGDFDKSMEYVISSATRNNFVGTYGATGVAAVACLSILALNIIPILRELVFFFYYTRTKISDYFSIQSELLKLNAQSVESDPYMKAKDRKEVSRKQYKVADVFDKIANKVAFDTKQSENKTKSETKHQEKYKTDDLLDSAPDSATSSIF